MKTVLIMILMKLFKERVNFVRNKLLERVKDSATKFRERRASISSSIGSQDSKKRKNSTDLESDPIRSRASSLSSTK